MDSKIEEINIGGDRIFLKRSKYFGWGIVNPIKVDGKINWKNFLIGGSWVRFGILVLLIILIGLTINEYATTVKLLGECLERTTLISIR